MRVTGFSTGPNHWIIACLTSGGQGAAPWMMNFTWLTSYFAFTSSGSASRRARTRMILPSSAAQGWPNASEAIAAAVNGALISHDAAVLPWLDGPPQTNEAGRSAGLMTGLLHVAARFGPDVDLLEIGSSAGLNLLTDRYAFDLGGIRRGPDDAPVLIAPEWRGPPPPDAPQDEPSEAN